MFVMVCYDIPSDKRRRKLAKVLARWLVRVQWSVFEGMITERHLEDLRKAVERTMDPSKDSVRLLRLCASCRLTIESLGVVSEPPGPPDDTVV